MRLRTCQSRGSAIARGPAGAGYASGARAAAPAGAAPSGGCRTADALFLYGIRAVASRSIG
jgi:hypothetical protein